jgi:hypothetical protein
VGGAELIEVRKAFRDVGRGALSHPAWRQLATSEPFLLEDATAIAADLAGTGELACWTEPPTSQQLIEDVRELLDFASDKEVVLERPATRHRTEPTPVRPRRRPDDLDAFPLRRRRGTTDPRGSSHAMG